MRKSIAFFALGFGLASIIYLFRSFVMAPAENLKWFNENQGVTMAGLTLAYVLATILLVFLSHRNIETLGELEEKRIRPYVTFNMTTRMPQRHVVASLKNTGLTAAHNVHVNIDPQLRHIVMETECAFTSQIIPFLAPHSDELVDLIGLSSAYYQEYGETVFKGTTEYENSSGKKFLEPFRIDLSFLRERMSTPEPSIIEELQELNKTLAKISEANPTQEEKKDTRRLQRLGKLRKI